MEGMKWKTTIILITILLLLAGITIFLYWDKEKNMQQRLVQQEQEGVTRKGIVYNQNPNWHYLKVGNQNSINSKLIVAV